MFAAIVAENGRWKNSDADEIVEPRVQAPIAIASTKLPLRLLDEEFNRIVTMAITPMRLYRMRSRNISGDE